MSKVFMFHFSPTGGTLKVAKQLASQISNNIEDIDLTKPLSNEIKLTSEDISIFALPVFSGRIPAITVDLIKSIKGNGSRAIAVVVYGNRAYEDALLELSDTLKSQDFKVIAGCATIAQHSIANAVGANRPDEKDIEVINSFAKQIVDKLANSDSCIEVPGNKPYREVGPTAATPITLDTCTKCKLCAIKCPTMAIPMDNPNTTDITKCILCMRCIEVCPQKSRILPPPMLEGVTKKLEPLTKVRNENELFI